MKNDNTIMKNNKNGTKSDIACLIIATRSDILLKILNHDIVFIAANIRTTTKSMTLTGDAPGLEVEELWSISE